MKTLYHRLMERWRAAPFACEKCGERIDAEGVGEGEHMAWCSSCKQVCHVPLMRVPNWAIAAVCVLVIKTQAGL